MRNWLKNRLLLVLLNTWKGWQADDGFLLSAAMAYYAAFSLFPLCLVLVSILGFVLRLSQQAADAQTLLLDRVKEIAGPWLADQLHMLLGGVKSHAGFGGPLGVAALLAAAIVVFLQLDYMFDRIWGTNGIAPKNWRGYVWTVLYDRLSAFLMLLAVGGLLLTLFVANVILAGARSQILPLLPGAADAWDWGQFLFNTVMNSLLFGILYKVLPKTRIPWLNALSGGAFVSLVLFLGQRLLVRLLIGTSYTAYGLVGSFIAVMIWVYYVSAILFLGAEFVRALSTFSNRVDTGEDERG